MFQIRRYVIGYNLTNNASSIYFSVVLDSKHCLLSLGITYSRELGLRLPTATVTVGSSTVSPVSSVRPGHLRRLRPGDAHIRE